MKQSIILIMGVLVLGSLLIGGDRWFIQGTLQGVAPADAKYKLVYHRFQISPDVRLSWNFFHHFHFWTGIGFFPARGTIPEFNVPARSLQIFLQAGLSWDCRIFRKFSLLVHAGGSLVRIEETSMGKTFRQNGSGLEGGVDVLFPLKKHLFLIGAVDYLFSRQEFKKQEIFPGGMRYGIGVGWKF